MNPCTYCGCADEVQIIRLVQWTNGYVDEERSIKCQRCGNLKWGNVKCVGKKEDL